jgi:hypothetical protein
MKMWNTVGKCMMDNYRTPTITNCTVCSTIVQQVVPVVVSGVRDGEVRCCEKRDAAREQVCRDESCLGARRL